MQRINPHIHQATVQDYASSESDIQETNYADGKKRKLSDSSESDILKEFDGAPSSASAKSSRYSRLHFEQRQALSENSKLRALFEEFGPNREKIFKMIDEIPHLTVESLSELAQTQIPVVPSQTNPDAYERISVLYTAKDDDEMKQFKSDIDRIGALLLERLSKPDMKYSLLDKAKLLEVSICLKRYSELCASIADSRQTRARIASVMQNRRGE